MAQALSKGAAKIEGVEVIIKKAKDASLDDLLSCDGLAIGSPEYFGYMAGAIKDFFDRTYIEAKEKTFRLPYVLFVCAGNDGRGAVTQIERITVGYKWKKIAKSIRAIVPLKEEILKDLEEMGQTLAAGVEAGIF
jgi:multimeric flavodoxin WrbA